MKKLLGGFFQKQKDPALQAQALSPQPSSATPGSATGPSRVLSPPTQYKHGPRSSWDTFFQSPNMAKNSIVSPPLPATMSMQVPAKIFNQNLEMLMREIVTKIKDVIARMLEDADFQNELAQLCGFINLAADKLLEKGDPSLVLLKNYFSSPAGVNLCEQTALPSLVLDFVNKVRVYIIKSELRQLEAVLHPKTESTDAVGRTSASTTAVELERPVHFLMNCVQAVASNVTLMEQFRCELPNVIHLIAEDYPPSAHYLRDLSSQILASIPDKNFNAGLVWYLNDCNTVGQTVKMMTRYSNAPQATPETAAAALFTLSAMTKSCVASSQSVMKEPIAAAVSNALGLSREVDLQSNETRQTVTVDQMDDEVMLSREDANSDCYQVVGRYDPTPGFKALIYTLQKTCRFSLVLLGEFQSSGGYSLLTKCVKSAQEREVSTLIYIYTLLLPLGTGFSGVCGEDENMATVSTCGARNIGAFLSIRDLVLDCMNSLKSAATDDVKVQQEQLLLQLLTTILQVYTSAYENFMCLEQKTQALAMILSRLPSITFFDAQIITLRIVEYVCVAAKAEGPLPVEILAVLCSQFIEFSSAEIQTMTESLDDEHIASASEFKAQFSGTDSRADIVCECILKILQSPRICAYRDEFHAFGLLERGVYALVVKLASSLSANASQPALQHQCLSMFKSRLVMWSSVASLMLENNPPLMKEFRDMQIHHSLYVIAGVMLCQELVTKNDTKPPVFSLFVVFAVVDPNHQYDCANTLDDESESQDHTLALRSGVESDLTRLLEFLQRGRNCRPKQEFLMGILQQMMHGQLFWDAWKVCQGHEILLSLLSSFHRMDEGIASDDDFLLLDGILEMICVTLDPSCRGNQACVIHFTDEIGFSTLAGCLVNCGVIETDRWSLVIGRIFEFITGLEAPRNKIRNPKAVEMLFCLLPHITPDRGEECITRLLSKITSNDDISFSRKKQVSSLVQAGVFRWISHPSVIAMLRDSAHQSNHVLLSLVTELSREELSTSYLREFIRVIAKSMPLLLNNHFHPSKTMKDADESSCEPEEVGLRLLRMALKGSPIPHVAVGTNIRTHMTSGYVHVNQPDRVWPPSSGYSFSCWLRFPPVDHKRRESHSTSPDEASKLGTVCVALCEGPLIVKLDGDEAEPPESYCVLVGAELSLFDSAGAARNSTKAKDILTVTAVAPKGQSDFLIWCNDKRYIARNPNGSVSDTEMWVRALQQSESISNKVIPTVTATADSGNPRDVLFVANNETSTAEADEESGLDGFVCLLSVYSTEASGCFTRIYFDQVSGCLRVDTGSAAAGPSVNPASKRTSAIFKNVNVNLLRSDSNLLDDREGSRDKASQWHHVALTHRKSTLGNSQVTLFIDGAEVATKKLMYPSAPIAGALQAFLGKDIQICGTFPALPWQVGPTWFLEDVLPSTAVVCIFLLGPAFRGHFGGHAYRSIGDWSEAIATNQLDRATKRRVEVSRAARRAQLLHLGKAARRQWYEGMILPGETQPGNAISELLMKKDDPAESGVGIRVLDSKKRHIKLMGFSSFINAECVMSVFGLEFLDALSSFKLPDKEVYFCINTSFEVPREPSSSGGRSAALVNYVGTEPSVPLNLAKAVPSLGGVIQFLLPLVDNAWRSHELAVALKLLCRCTRRNPSCLAEFLDNNGYALIASILRTRVHLIDEVVLKSVLRLAISGSIQDGSRMRNGTTSNSASQSPYIWPLVVDFAGLSKVVLSHHLRLVLPTKYQVQLIATIKLLIDTENPNAIFNARQLRQANLLSWILHFLANICNCDSTVNDQPGASDRFCFPIFTEVLNNEVFGHLVSLLQLYVHIENHIDDIALINDTLLMSMSNQKPFGSAKSSFRVAILQFLLREIEDNEGQKERTASSREQGHNREGVKMKKDKDEGDPLSLTMVESVVLKNDRHFPRKRKDRGDAGLSMLASPTSPTVSLHEASGTDMIGVLCDIICRKETGKFARLEALLSVRILLSLAQDHPSFARHLLQNPTLLERLKRALYGYSADCYFYTPLLAFVSNIPIRETRYHDPVLAVNDAQQFALPSPNAFANDAAMESLDQVWDLIGAMLHRNCVISSEATEKTTVIVLKQVIFQVEVNEAFFTTVCHSSFVVLRTLAFCLVHRPAELTESAGPKASIDHTSLEENAALSPLLSGFAASKNHVNRASACLDLLRVFFTRSLFEREEFAVDLIYLLDRIDEETQTDSKVSPSAGQKCWLGLLVHVVKQSKAFSNNCSFPVLKNLSTLGIALARYLLDDSKHQDVQEKDPDHGQQSDTTTRSTSRSTKGSPGSCFGTDILNFYLKTVRFCADTHVGQLVGVEDQQFFYGCFVYCVQAILLSELGGAHQCSSPPQRLLDCLTNSRQFFIQQNKVSGVIICSSHQHHPAHNIDVTTASAASRGLNAHVNKMKSLTAAAMHREFGIGAESDRSFLLSLAGELLRWLIDDSELVRHTSIAIWQFLFQQRMGVIKELLIVEPKVSLLQNMSSNKKEVIDVFHGGFDRLLKIAPPRTSSDTTTSARISSGELSASHESWLQFHIWLTENFDLLKELIVARTEPIWGHMIEVLQTCEFVRKVSSSSASNRASAQPDLSLNLDFSRCEQHSHLSNRIPKSTTASTMDDEDLLGTTLGRIATRKAHLRFSNALECSLEDMHDASMRWREVSTRLHHTRAVWHVEALSLPSSGVQGESAASSSRTSSGSHDRVAVQEPFYLERSVFQQDWYRYRLDFTEGPQRMRLRMVRGYEPLELTESSHAVTKPLPEDSARQTAPAPLDPLLRKLEFHQCVEAFREFMFKKRSRDASEDSHILSELAKKSTVERVQVLLQGGITDYAKSRYAEMDKRVDSSDSNTVATRQNCTTVLAINIYTEFLDGDKGAMINVSPAVAKAILHTISSVQDGVTGSCIPSTLFDVADLESMQASLNAAGGSIQGRDIDPGDRADGSDDDDDEDAYTTTNDVAHTSPVMSDSEDSASDDEETERVHTIDETSSRRSTDSARVLSMRSSVKIDDARNDADTGVKLPDNKIVEGSSDYVFGAIARFLHRDDYPPLRAYDAAYVVGMSKAMGVFLICTNAIYFVGGYEKQLSEADNGSGAIAVMTSSTPSSQSVAINSTNPISPTKTLTGKKAKDMLRETFADIGISLSGTKTSGSPLYSIVPIRNNTPVEAQSEADTSSADVRGASSRIQRWSIKYSDVRQFYRIKYQLRPVGIEFFDTSGSTFFVQYESTLEREEVVKVLFQMPIVNSVFWNPLLRSSALSLSVKRIRQNLTKRWLKGGVSNFEYLMHLNTLAGRSFNDITQYPVFPWILADYNSKVLNLDNPSTFRDLSKPMGALGASRASLFRERYAAMNYDAAHSPMDSPAFHYGTHYSCSAYVVNYLIRMEPFSQLARELQGGSFDHADRLFRSIPASWHSASTENLQDVRELVPEFFFLPEFLYNSNNYDLGTTQGGEVVSHVKLPVWAHGDPREFIRLHRLALESKYVSENLHHWIDLIFGYKQTGADALEAQNVFMHFTYEGAVDLDAIEDPVMRNAMLAQIENFGQTPSKLFTTPHPARKVPVLTNGATQASLNSASTPPGIGQPYEGNTMGNIEAFIKWHTPLSPALVSIGNDYVLLKKHSTANVLEAAVGDIRVVGDKFQCRGVGCTFMPPRFTKYLEWGSNPEGAMKLRVHSSSARHREANKVVGVIDGAHNSRVNCAAFSNDGVILVTGGLDAAVNVLECSKQHGQRQFKQITKLVGHDDAVTSVAISRPLNLVASASRDGSLILWDLRTRTYLRELRGHSGLITDIGVNGMSGNIVACSSSEMRLWSINGDLLATTTTQAVGLSAITRGISTNCESWQNGIFAVTGHSNGTVALWGVRFPSDIASEDMKHNEDTDSTSSRFRSGSSYSSGTLRSAVHVGVAGRHSFTGVSYSDGEPKVLKAIPTCQLVIKKLLMDHRAAITTLHLGSDQRQLLSADEDGLCIRWADDSISAYAS